MAARRFSVTVRFNSRLKGAGQSYTCEVEADYLDDALTAAANLAVRLPEHGQSIYVTGCTIDEVKS